MTRTWTEIDPAPADQPTVVDPDGCTWSPEDDGCGGVAYARQRVEHHGAMVSRGPICWEWHEIFECLPEGAVLREASSEEARVWVEAFPEVSP